MPKKFADSIYFKIALLLLVTLLLCIPLSEIRSIIAERELYRSAAHAELAQTYTGPQTLVGPLILHPYTESWTEEERSSTGAVIKRTAHSVRRVKVLPPQSLNLTGSLNPEERYRGIFKVMFYQLAGDLHAEFSAPQGSPTLPHRKDASIEWHTPVISLAVSDLRGFIGSPQLSVDGEHLQFSKTKLDLPEGFLLGGGIHAPLHGAALSKYLSAKPMRVDVTLQLAGQRSLTVVPVASDTSSAKLTSSWAHPSFGGRFLPIKRVVTENGFDAQWSVSDLGSNVSAALASLPVAAREGDPDHGGTATHSNHDFEQAMVGLDSFGVSLVEPQNVYSMSERAIKYGALIVGLVLLAAFMFELFRQLRMHPIQYGLVGLSIALFFLLLLALSEKLIFAAAYGLAACASVGLLAVYFSAVLRSWGRGLTLSAFVAVLYGALFGLLASENNSLILGSLLLFGMLATLMVATRRVDWYALSSTQSPAPSPAPSSMQ